LKPTLNVLVTAASRRVPLVLALKKGLEDAGVVGKVLVTDVNPLSPAVHVADGAFAVPISADPSYVDVVEAICVQERIGLVVPTIDDELPTFSAQTSRFDRIGAFVAVSPLETTSACNDKLETCVRLRQAGVRAAATYLPADLPADVAFPVFAKPRFGRGSVGAFRVDSRRHLSFFVDYIPTPVVQEYLDGPEYTIDMFCDRAGEPLSIVPRRRVVIRAGVIDRGHTSDDPALIELGRSCARAFRFVGPINIQCSVVSDGPTVFEINPRFSGGIPLTIAAGGDFARWLIDLALDRPLPAPLVPFTPNLWVTNYEAGIFLAEDRFSVLGPCPEVRQR
jgi:carbamoyl-phosphate synthase large subunit